MHENIIKYLKNKRTKKTKKNKTNKTKKTKQQNKKIFNICVCMHELLCEKKQKKITKVAHRK